MAIPVAPIILAAAPLARDLVMLIIEAVQAAQDDDVTPEQIDTMLATIEAKNIEVQTLVDSIRRQRVGPG